MNPLGANLSIELGYPSGVKSNPMATITDKKGVIHMFEPLTYKESNLRKVNLNTDNGPNGEGIWAALSDDDLKKYDEDTKSGDFVCMLVNHALAFMPQPSWGMHVLARFNGTSRPVADLSRVDYSVPENRVWADMVPPLGRKAPEEGDKVKLKSPEQVLEILRELGWNGTDANRVAMAEEYGGKTVEVYNPQPHHAYFFVKGGPTVHYSMVEDYA